MKKLFAISILCSLLMGCTANPVTENENRVALATPNHQKPKKMKFFPNLASYTEKIIANIDNIPPERKALLEELSEHIGQQASTAQLIFICTHNSRRSHLAQIWAATAAAYYGIENIETYSGGTEATAFNPRAVAAIESAGFKVEKSEDSDNPRYLVASGEGSGKMLCFSKKYSDETNPQQDFIAVMVCSDADKGCPIVGGAAARIAIPYIDPKISDGTADEAATYNARSLEIATEMFYVFSAVKKTAGDGDLN